MNENLPHTLEVEIKARIILDFPYGHDRELVEVAERIVARNNQARLGHYYPLTQIALHDPQSRNPDDYDPHANYGAW